ncbi:MAG: S-methyl-5-thioribose-1-phosphate isomerase [Candidatus Nezhaarchaeota archaeon]|nr:S-methyl-5-thioribose-1-phosphate isomerase [Candidatus Nezhaarchaeota archaeon]
MEFQTIWWEDGVVYLVDQNRLPRELAIKSCRSVEEVAKEIKNMTIRGAPAIGAAAALGLALTAYHSPAQEVMERLERAAKLLLSTRPTARNLQWAVERVLRVARLARGGDVRENVLEEALRIVKEDVEVNEKIGKVGVGLLNDGDVVLTHCNAGSLATVRYGTALAPVREAAKKGLRISVIVTETRPKLQGARLTAFELKAEGIPLKVITDGMVGYVMREGLVDKVIVGADRILSDGTVINKIGTLTIAIVANFFKVPFYVAAPTSTFDLEGQVSDIHIEHRGREEVAYIAGQPILPSGVEVLNPSFDITPPSLIETYITEKGLLKPPFKL